MTNSDETSMKVLAIAFLVLLANFTQAKEPADDGVLAGISPQTPAILCADQADNRIRLVDPFAKDADDADLWSYPASQAPPSEYVPTDAKRVEIDGEVFILAAYHGRVRLVRFRDSKLIKDYPSYSSCHSAELLPDGSIATVNSNHSMLRLHHSANDFVDTELPYAHGVTWDKKRQCLWVLGDQLYRFRYRDRQLSLDQQYALPQSPTGHDLFPLRTAPKLLVSNNDALYLFDIETEAFQLLSDLKWIKSASQSIDGSLWISDPQRTEVGANWQSDSIIPAQPTESKQRHTIAGSKFYKARWWQSVDFSY
ncbi:putative secreted protein [Rhodopirellula europaea 6C]|uniref:Putative secreted protein n=2 Tax=Rhodopirellula TaxID=265488 RepID=M2B1X6_9BACT|nr:putative secreted protein [Rhodopirellula europaea 6C]